MGAVTGKRAGTRRPSATARRPSPTLLALTLATTLLVVAWGYLVYAAIDFGTSARDGRGEAWWFLAMACLGAVACLFAGLLLAARILRHLATGGPSPTGADGAPARTPGGARRASR